MEKGKPRGPLLAGHSAEPRERVPPKDEGQELCLPHTSCQRSGSGDGQGPVKEG